MAAYNITTTRGDQWQGANFEILLNNSPLDLTGATILMQLRKSASCDSEALLTFTETSGITVTDAVAGLFKIDPVIIELSPRDYVYDIQLTLASGRVVTPVNGTFTVTQDVSR